MTKTSIMNKNELKNEYILLDADGIPLGRLSVKIANILRGKDKPTYSTNLDTGSSVVVINASKVILTGKKNTDKKYQSYSGYRGGLKIKSATEVRKKNPTFLISHAVWGMIPHGRMGRKMFTKLKVYSGSSHPHKSQNPKLLIQ